MAAYISYENERTLWNLRKIVDIGKAYGLAVCEEADEAFSKAAELSGDGARNAAFQAAADEAFGKAASCRRALDDHYSKGCPAASDADCEVVRTDKGQTDYLDDQNKKLKLDIAAREKALASLSTCGSDYSRKGVSADASATALAGGDEGLAARPTSSLARGASQGTRASQPGAIGTSLGAAAVGSRAATNRSGGSLISVATARGKSAAGQWALISPTAGMASPMAPAESAPGGKARADTPSTAAPKIPAFRAQAAACNQDWSSQEASMCNYPGVNNIWLGCWKVFDQAWAQCSYIDNACNTNAINARHTCICSLWSKCQCSSNTFDSKGNCITACQGGSLPDAAGKCCIGGQVVGGKCSCSGGKVLTGDTCKCSSGIEDASGNCKTTCPDGGTPQPWGCQRSIAYEGSDAERSQLQKFIKRIREAGPKGRAFIEEIEKNSKPTHVMISKTAIRQETDPPEKVFENIVSNGGGLTLRPSESQSHDIEVYIAPSIPTNKGTLKRLTNCNGNDGQTILLAVFLHELGHAYLVAKGDPSQDSVETMHPAVWKVINR
ncbi:MAG: hypothetical protein NTX64_11810, partial [Elusimicrobia bacterium]|nr:hypothetical protein [Elusimicrobiota bacterium]